MSKIDDEWTRSQFLAILSHELKTPINSINGFAQLLLQQTRSPLSLEQADMVERILNNGNTLLSLINNLLDLTQLDAGGMQLHLESVNVAHVIQRTIRDLSSLSRQHNLTFRTDIRLSDLVIINDPMRLRQILVNLLSNAINVSEDGEIGVIVDADDAAHVKIAVLDAGPGIAPEDMGKIFNEFWQGPRCLETQPLGTGLGLAISQGLAKMMAGTINVYSQLGEGTTFQLVIPRRVVS